MTQACLPQRGLSHIETALEVDPTDPWAHAMLGAWRWPARAERASSTPTCRPAFGRAAYRRAVAMDGVEPAIPYHFAPALIAADPNAHGDEAEALLDQAISTPADNAFDEAAYDLARSLTAAFGAVPAQARVLPIDRLEQ